MALNVDLDSEAIDLTMKSSEEYDQRNEFQTVKRKMDVLEEGQGQESVDNFKKVKEELKQFGVENESSKEERLVEQGVLEALMKSER